MTYYSIKDRAYTTLASGIGNAATVAWFVSGGVFPSTDCVLTIDNERFYMASRSGNVADISGAQFGSTAESHEAGVTVALNVGTAVVGQIQSGIVALEAVSGVSPVSGRVAAVEAVSGATISDITALKNVSGLCTVSGRVTALESVSGAVIGSISALQSVSGAVILSGDVAALKAVSGAVILSSDVGALKAVSGVTIATITALQNASGISPLSGAVSALKAVSGSVYAHGATHLSGGTQYISGVMHIIENTAFGTTWSGVAAIAPSKGAVFAEMETAVRIVSAPLSGVAQSAFAFFWQNPKPYKVFAQAIVHITSACGAAAVLDVGAAASATTGSNDLIDHLDMNQIVYVDLGTTTILDENGGSMDFITGQVLNAAATSTAGKFYVRHWPV